ncbi:MAG: nucleotidyltransferase family protein [Rectinemataceae bacterium]
MLSDAANGFGSRAKGLARRSSDFDIGIRGLERDDFIRFKRRIEEWVEYSPIPHSVDIVNFDFAPEPLRSLGLRDRIVWKYMENISGTISQWRYGTLKVPCRPWISATN